MNEGTQVKAATSTNRQRGIESEYENDEESRAFVAAQNNASTASCNKLRKEHDHIGNADQMLIYFDMPSNVTVDKKDPN